MPKFEILSIRANAINSSNPKVTCQFHFQAAHSTWGVSHSPRTNLDPRTDLCLSPNLNIVSYQISRGMWHVVGINCYLKLLQRYQTRAMFLTFVIFIAVEMWCPSSYSPHTQNSHWLLVFPHKLHESLQRKIALGNLSWELILSSAERHRFCWMITVIPFSEQSFTTQKHFMVLIPYNLLVI